MHILRSSHIKIIIRTRINRIGLETRPSEGVIVQSTGTRNAIFRIACYQGQQYKGKIIYTYIL